MAFGGEKKEMYNYDRNIQFVRDINLKKYFKCSIGFGFVNFFTNVINALIFWYGVKLILEKHETGAGLPRYDIGHVVTV